MSPPKRIFLFLPFQFVYFLFHCLALLHQYDLLYTVLNRRDEGDIFISFPILGKSFTISPLSGMFVLDVLETFFVRLMKFPSILKLPSRVCLLFLKIVNGYWFYQVLFLHHNYTLLNFYSVHIYLYFPWMRDRSLIPEIKLNLEVLYFFYP